jgi:hypothetical protein
MFLLEWEGRISKESKKTQQIIVRRVILIVPQRRMLQVQVLPMPLQLLGHHQYRCLHQPHRCNEEWNQVQSLQVRLLKKILSIVAPNGHHLREDSTNLLHPADHMNLHRLLKVEVDHHNNPWYHLAGNHPLYRMEIVGVAMLVAVVENCILLIIQNILVLPSRVVVVVVVLVVVYTTLHRAAATSTSTADLVVCAMEVVWATLDLLFLPTHPL